VSQHILFQDHAGHQKFNGRELKLKIHTLAPSCKDIDEQEEEYYRALGTLSGIIKT
jgi:hypothetical protein